MTPFCPDGGVFQLAAYRYNGLGKRIMWQYDVDSTNGLEADEQYYFVHDAKGRVVASMRHTGSGDVVTIQEAFVYHAAGIAGRGGSSLSESAILRDVDSDYKWATASDDVLNVRTFYVQNWKGDVVAVLDSDGKPLERIRYTAFGTPSAHPIADVDGNGKVEAADVTKFLAFAAGGANATVFTETDLNADGLFPDDADIEFFDDEYVRLTNDGATTRTFGMNSISGVGNREGFGGASWDTATKAWKFGVGMFDSESGNWANRSVSGEPAGPTWSFPMPGLWDDCIEGSFTLEGCLECCVSGKPPSSNINCAEKCFAKFGDSGDSFDEPPREIWEIIDSACKHRPGYKRAREQALQACGRLPSIDQRRINPGAAHYCCLTQVLVPYRRISENEPPNASHCDTLAHELIHAADACSGRNPCDRSPDGCGFIADCQINLVSEARAFAQSGQCCSHEFESREQCVRRNITPYATGCEAYIDFAVALAMSEVGPCR